MRSILREDLLVARRLVAGDRQHLGDVHALVAHALGVLDHVQQRRDDAQVARDRRLQREQREDPLVDLEVAAVDPVVVGDHDRRELDVAVVERLQRAVERRRRPGRARRAPAPRAARAPPGSGCRCDWPATSRTCP